MDGGVAADLRGVILTLYSWRSVRLDCTLEEYTNILKEVFIAIVVNVTI